MEIAVRLSEGRLGLGYLGHACGVAGDHATVAALINVVPRLLQAPAGVRLMTELPVPAWTPVG